mgnify:CR=1 FL=1
MHWIRCRLALRLVHCVHSGRVFGAVFVYGVHQEAGQGLQQLEHELVSASGAIVLRVWQSLSSWCRQKWGLMAPSRLL